MGRIVINETENKQTVILNDRASGVTGGYFDSGMNWHEFGGGGAEIPVIKVYAGKGINTTTGELTDNPARAASEIIPVSADASPIVLQQYVPSGYKQRVVGYSESGYVNLTITVVNPSVIGTTTAWTNLAFNNISSGILGLKPSGNNPWEAYTGDITGIRFYMEKEDSSANVDANDIDGYAFISGVLYHLVGE